MISNEQKDFIYEYVDEKYYDTDKLIKYLELHDVVGNEIFLLCDKKIDDHPTYSCLLDSDSFYSPLSVECFIKRIPFFFYVGYKPEDESNNLGNLSEILSAYYDIKKDSKMKIDDVYSELEFAFYQLKLDLSQIFNYYIQQCDRTDKSMFFHWCDYLHLCVKQNCDDYFPERFITAYNDLLEKSRLKPIIYEVSENMRHELFYRYRNVIEFEGVFPCDSNGQPIMKWIGIKAQNIKNISCNCEKSKRGTLYIEITPNSIIHIIDPYSENYEWYHIYSGPKMMKFNNSVLKEYRKKLNYTQKEVADAIDTSVRTYQKWEAGETTPDGHYLIRLLNYFDIDNVQDIIEYSTC